MTVYTQIFHIHFLVHNYVDVAIFWKYKNSIIFFIHLRLSEVRNSNFLLLHNLWYFPTDHLPGAASYKQKSLPTPCSTPTMQEVTSQTDLYVHMLHYWPTANEPHLPDTSRTLTLYLPYECWMFSIFMHAMKWLACVLTFLTKPFK
jgi:hypothetical protein